MRLTAQQLELLARLGKSPEGQQLQALVKAEIDDVNLQLRSLSGDHLSRAQGRAAYLDDLAKHLNGAVSTASRPAKPAPWLPVVSS